MELSKESKAPNWNKKIIEVEIYFANTGIPTYPIKLNKTTTIINGQKFVKNHFKTMTKKNKDKTFISYLHRLQALKEILK